MRLQADTNSSAIDLNSKINRSGAEISFLNRQRRFGCVIFLTFGMSLSFILSVLVIVIWLMITERSFQNVGIPVSIEEMFERSSSSTTQQSPSNAGAPVLDQRPVSTPQPAPPMPQQFRGIGIRPPSVQQQPLPAQQQLTPEQSYNHRHCNWRQAQQLRPPCRHNLRLSRNYRRPYSSAVTNS